MQNKFRGKNSILDVIQKKIRREFMNKIGLYFKLSYKSIEYYLTTAQLRIHILSNLMVGEKNIRNYNNICAFKTFKKVIN